MATEVEEEVYSRDVDKLISGAVVFYPSPGLANCLPTTGRNTTSDNGPHRADARLPGLTIARLTP